MVTKNFIQRFFFSCSLLFWNIVAFAQDKDVDVNIRTEGDGGIFGGNLFWMLLLVGVIVLLIIGMSLRGRTHTHVEEPHHHHHS